MAAAYAVDDAADPGHDIDKITRTMSQEGDIVSKSTRNGRGGRERSKCSTVRKDSGIGSDHDTSAHSEAKHETLLLEPLGPGTKESRPFSKLHSHTRLAKRKPLQESSEDSKDKDRVDSTSSEASVNDVAGLETMCWNTCPSPF